MFSDPSNRQFYAVRHEDDVATVRTGSLIPTRGRITYVPEPGAYMEEPTRKAFRLPWRGSFLVLSAILIGGGVFGITKVPYAQTLTANIADSEELPPTIVIENPYTKEQTPLNYGVNVTFSQPDFFADARNAMIEGGETFLEADLTTMQLRFFKDGVLTKQVPIRAKGESGSWWETPAGLYKIEAKHENHYSKSGSVYQPWMLGFQGNFSIHGWPEHQNGEPVDSDFLAGCIRLSNEDASVLYPLVPLGTPILVHEVSREPDQFLYEPKVPELETPHYLIADVESSTVLASSDLDAEASIASLTKLMTALIAAEYISLDTTVSINQETFVQSLVPRLGERTSVSMYSLLQLLLVESSNEAADIIADQIGRETFITHMNNKAKALGLMHTRFADPSGLSADNVSSVGDLLRLTQYIHEHRRFIFEITKNTELSSVYVSGEFGELMNFNEVDDLENFIGGKVGETLAAGQTSVTLHTLDVKGEERVVAIVILGSTSRNADVRQLFEYAEERFGS